MLGVVLQEFAHKYPDPLTAVKVSGGPWSLSATLESPVLGVCAIRNVNEQDVNVLWEFGRALGPRSRELFCPYPWDAPQQLTSALKDACAKSAKQIDATYILLVDDEPAAHFFLWKAGGNPTSAAFGVEVPELGVAVADRYHGQGLGWLCVRLLQEVARSLGRDAVELTTAPSNDAGYRTYVRCGFVDTGDIYNPLEVDVTAATAGEVAAQKFRVERQMVFMINADKSDDVARFLASKRQTSFQPQTQAI